MTAKTDWEAIERDYRAGVLSFAEIGKQHGVSKGRISQVAKAKGWTRDLSAKIKAKAEAKLNAEAINGELNAERSFSEHVLIEANATVIAKVRSDHRKDIGRSRELVVKLLSELEAQTEHQDLFEELGELMAAPDDRGQDKRREAYLKVISLSGRVSNIKALADALKNLVALEREAYSLDEKEEEGAAKRALTDAERASRLATILERARTRAGAPPPSLPAPGSDARH